MRQRRTASDNLQSRLSVALKARLPAVDSPEYSLTWKESTTPAGRPYCRLVASGAPHRRLRIFWIAALSVAESSGFRTATQGAESQRQHGGTLHTTNRSGIVPLADTEGAGQRPCGAEAAEQIGRQREPGRASPRMASDGMEHATSDGREQGRAESIGRGFGSGCGDDGMGNASGTRLEGWQSEPGNARQEFSRPLNEQATMLGPIPSSSTAETESAVAYRLNPHFSRWLQGFPAAWDAAAMGVSVNLGDTGIQLCLKLQQSS